MALSSRGASATLPAVPAPPDAPSARYTRAPLPAYAYIPGQAPHPRRDRRGHSYGLPELRPEPLDPSCWARSERYLRGVDLYNFDYFWECHEVFEAIWHGAGKTSVLGQFAQGVVQIAAAHLKRSMGAHEAASKLLARGLGRLAGAPSPYLGFDVRRFEREVAAYFEGKRALRARIALDLPG